MSTTCCACFARTTVLMSNGCKVSPHLLRDDFAGHLRMNRAEVRIRSGLAEGERELFIRVEHFGLERSVRADDRMGNVVAIGPSDRSPHRHCKRSRAEAEVVDLDFRRCCWRGLSGGLNCLLLRSNQRRPSNCHHSKTYDTNDSLHVFSFPILQTQVALRTLTAFRIVCFGLRQTGINDRQRMLALHIIHVGDSEYAAELFRWNFHRPRRIRLTRLGLWERGRSRSVEGPISLDLLHRRVNMPVN